VGEGVQQNIFGIAFKNKEKDIGEKKYEYHQVTALNVPLPLRGDSPKTGKNARKGKAKEKRRLGPGEKQIKRSPRVGTQWGGKKGNVRKQKLREKM